MVNDTETLDAILQRLLQNEKRGAVNSTEALLQCFEKVRRHISKIMGAAGYRALLDRALSLSKKKILHLLILL